MLSQLFEFNATQYNKPDLLSYRGGDGISYRISSNEFRERVIDFALALKSLGVKPKSKVLLLSENRPEWHVVDFACHLLGAVVVPVFPNLVADQIEYIAKNSDSEFIVISNEIQANKIRQTRQDLKKIKQIMTMKKGIEGEGFRSFDDILAQVGHARRLSFWKNASIWPNRMTLRPSSTHPAQPDLRNV
ncbi:long-chain fatty acid--CoA ligase [candidate division KSB1 bacterium]|nr:long-chain fatty acid--CoA ligase [candidate division KSB1 bacterium]NIU27335.1 long-chain fatty acid--CoA ligase [candidate division KSB1 bacterium]NIW21225.1 AMP-binding protein [candidate division KSB1 bacterium]NIW71779.1 AMP-binding protein [candidate division KSB1 bacterium]